MGQFLRPMVRPPRFSKPKGYETSGLHSLHCAHFIILSPHQVQEEFAFVPDDCSATYVLNVESNTTQTLAGPSTKDAGASYFASINSLVQLSSNGAVSYLSYNPNDTSANAAAQWNNVGSLAKAAPPTNGTSTGTSTSSFVNPSQTLRAQTSSKSANGAVAVVAPTSLLCGLASVAMLACAAVLF
jgi:hypothetical protein